MNLFYFTMCKMYLILLILENRNLSIRLYLFVYRYEICVYNNDFSHTLHLHTIRYFLLN